MAASAAASAFFPVRSSAKPTAALGGAPESLNARGSLAKPQSSIGAIKANAQAGARVAVKTEPSNAFGDSPAAARRTFYNQLPDWSVLLAAITTIFLAAEKQWTFLDWKPKRPDMLTDSFSLGTIVDDGFVYRQDFSIRSYEIGADRTASIETMMNHLQETALNHARCAGLMCDGDGLGSTPEMIRRDLIWVIRKVQIQVEYYPSWGDVVQVDTWVAQAGRNGMRRDWHFRDSRTGQTIMRATSICVMINKLTRTVKKIPEEVRAEIAPYFVERPPITGEDSRMLTKIKDDTADYVRTGLTPRWSDLDANQHVNNVKYIGWILESAPISIMETHKLASMTLEYRRECVKGSQLQSLSSLSTKCADDGVPDSSIECEHLLRFESGLEVLKGRTEWRPKRANTIPDPMPAESA